MSLEVGTNTYISLTDAKTYVVGAIHSAPWDNAKDSERTKALITATRMFERQAWVGTKTATDQNLQWPRTGVTDRDGEDVADDEVPQDIIDAEVELAIALLDNAAVQSSQSTAQTNKRVKAGSVEVEFFKLPKNQQTKYPKIVQDLLSHYMSSAADLGGSVAYGTSDNSSFDSCDEFDLTRGF